MAGRILILDDDPNHVLLLETMLASTATAIHALTESQHFETVFAQFEPDLVLLDLHMPEPDGFEILQRLRPARSRLGFLPVIVLTADESDQSRRRALVLGADDYLKKPLDRDEVVLRVRNLLRTRDLFVQLAEARKA